MKTSHVALTVGAIIVVLVGWSIADRGSAFQDGKNMSSASEVESVGVDDWVRGNPDASVTLIEYSDFQCPACATYEPVVHQILEEFDSQMKFVYRHFPLRSIHRNAEGAARAAEAAGLQGKFWEMHDRLFDGQSAWAQSNNAQETFEFYAQELGLDVERFRDDMKSGVVKDRVNEDYSSGTAARVGGTPTFFLNGKKLDSPASYQAFKVLIENELKNQQ